MLKSNTHRLSVFFATLLIYANFGLAVQMRAPAVTVNTLFEDLIISDEFEGWKIVGVTNILAWTQGHGERGRFLALNRESPIQIPAVTVNPVLLNAANQEFFSEVPNDFARDGTWMGFKYAFLPESVVPPKDSDLSSPIYFFLLQKVPAQPEGIQFEVPDPEAIERDLAKRANAYYCLHQAQVHREKNQPGWCKALSKKAASKGDARAQYRYAELLRLGEGGPIDLVNARAYYKLAADQGLKVAQYNYAGMLYRAEGGPVDLVDARAYFKLSAEQGKKEAQYNYAVMLYKGEGGPVDLVNARAYFQLSAEQGKKEAQYNYAGMLYKGQGGPVDLVNARAYFKLSAEQGTKEAQYNYAGMLFRGEGGPVDLVNARAYYKLAADQGHLKAIEMLKSLDAEKEKVEVESAEPVEKKLKPE